MIIGTIAKARWKNANRWYEAEFVRDLLGILSLSSVGEVIIPGNAE
jgi:hypothetical protein